MLIKHIPFTAITRTQKYPNYLTGRYTTDLGTEITFIPTKVGSFLPTSIGN